MVPPPKIDSNGGARVRYYMDGWQPMFMNSALLVIGKKRFLDPQDAWCRIITDYSERRLPVPSDKLIAISALAETLNASANLRYMAGIWLKDFGHQLTWAKREGVADLKDRPSTYRAPSWSWASVEGGIMWHSIYVEKI